MSDQFRMLSWRIGAPLEGTPAESDPNGGSHSIEQGPGQGHITADEAGQTTIPCSQFATIDNDRKDPYPSSRCGLASVVATFASIESAARLGARPKFWVVGRGPIRGPG
ncbi:hypothetical protein [Bradyrhizobium elkanii]|uniref:hypothetical protein n=1 Tax=Bradyrhizobium elkanii TaxID=29448 RepID=UPI0012FD998D|nr:hypothetical protein [Bradyrhizobium elkanii]WLA85162.1 hypothetical protein QNJ99_13595 [Bradyrhizobium elkanii]